MLSSKLFLMTKSAKSVHTQLQNKANTHKRNYECSKRYTLQYCPCLKNIAYKTDALTVPAWYSTFDRLTYWYQIKEKLTRRKEYSDTIKNNRNIQTRNGKYRCHVAASCTYHLSLPPSSWERATQKSLSLNERYWRVFGEEREGRARVRRMDHAVAETNKTERATRRRRRTREETAKGNQMTALRFQTGG